ncbi:MAG TPA: formate/nitrite transporter family protein [Chthoniobacterales bacterium]
MAEAKPVRSTNAAELEEEEHQEASERGSPRAAVVYEAIRREGSDELERPSSALFWSGLAAGLSMGFSLVAEGLLRAVLPDASWRPLVVKTGYALGFIIVILGRQQLFTENTLTPILPLLQRKTARAFADVCRLCVVVLTANVIGTAIFGWLAARAPAFSEETKTVFSQIAAESLTGPALEHFVGAIFAGWLIALIVWLLPFAETNRVFIILLLTWVIGVAHFPHIIAGSVTMFYAIIHDGAPLIGCLANYWLPTLAGNIIGGVTLVAALNHAQVVAGDDVKLE